MKRYLFNNIRYSCDGKPSIIKNMNSGQVHTSKLYTSSTNSDIENNFSFKVVFF